MPLRGAKPVEEDGGGVSGLKGATPLSGGNLENLSRIRDEATRDEQSPQVNLPTQTDSVLSLGRFGGPKTEIPETEAEGLGEQIAGGVFDVAEKGFDAVVEQLSNTKFFREAAGGLEAIEQGRVSDDADDFFDKTHTFPFEADPDIAQPLLEGAEETSKSFSGRGTANIIDTFISDPANFATRSTFGKSNPIGNFFKGVAEETRQQFTTEKSQETSIQDFSKEKIQDPDFWTTTIAEQIPQTLAFFKAAQPVATGVANKTKALLGSSPFANIAAKTAGFAGGGTAMRAFEGAAEAEEVYNRAKQRGMSEQEAIQAGQDVFVDNMKLAGLDAVQVALALSPLKLKGSNALSKIVTETTKLAAGGATEAGEEIFQERAQAQALGDEFSLSDPQTQEAGFIGGVMGVLFQGAGRVSETVESRMREQFLDEVAAKFPDNIREEYKQQGDVEAKQQYMDRVAIQAPELVAGAVQQVEAEKQQAAENTKQTIRNIRDFINENTSAGLAIENVEVGDQFEHEGGQVTEIVDQKGEPILYEATNEQGERIGTFQTQEEAQGAIESAIEPEGGRTIEEAVEREEEGFVDQLEGSESRTQTQGAIREETEGRATRRSEKMQKSETTLLKERIRNIGRGAREGERFGRQKVEQRIEQLNEVIDNSNLSLKDKAKLRKKPKQVAQKKGEEAFQGVIEDTINTINRLEQEERARTVKSHIKKELKRTKPKKQSGKTKGKYTPEIQEVLDAMRESVKLTIDEAEQRIQDNLDKYTDEIPPLEVQMENRVLSMVAGKMNPEEMQGLLDDITDIIDEGRMMNALREFNRKTELQRDRQHVVDKITAGEGVDPTLATTGEKRKTTLEKVKTSLKTLGKKWLANWEGLMDILDWNAPVDNKTLADRFNVNAELGAYKDRQSQYAETLKNILIRSYGLDDTNADVRRKVIELQEDVDVGTFVNANGNEVTIQMTRDELIKRWMELQDPSLQDSFRRGNLYTDEIIEAIDNAMSEGDKNLARAQFQAYRQQYQDINDVYKDIYGVNLPENENYSPIRREGFQIDEEASLGPFMEEQSFRNAVSSSALKSRVKNTLPIKKQGAISAFEQHFANTNYFIAWGKKVRDLQAVFTDPEVRKAVKTTFNKETLDAIGNSIEDFATNGNRNTRTIKALDWFRKKFAVGVLSVKPAIAIKQLTSTVAYWEEVSVSEWVAGVAEFYKNPVRNYETLKEESAFIRNRGSNLERDIRDAQQSDAYQRFTKRKSFINTLMMNVTVGDMGAVAAGSWAMRRARTKQYQKEGMTQAEARQQAIEDYERFGNATQQSSDLSELSEVQRGGSFAKLFTMFKSAPAAYLRKEVNAVQSLFQEGGFKKENLKKVGKTMFIYHILLPMFFQFVSDFGEFDEDEQARAAFLGSINGAFIMGDAISGVVRTAMGMKTWSNEVPIYELPNAVSKIVSNIDFDEVGDEDFFDALSGLSQAGNAVGLPTEQAWQMTSGVAGVLEGNTRDGIGQLLGWTDYALQESDEDLTLEMFEEEEGSSLTFGDGGGSGLDFGDGGGGGGSSGLDFGD